MILKTVAEVNQKHSNDKGEEKNDYKLYKG